MIDFTKYKRKLRLNKKWKSKPIGNVDANGNIIITSKKWVKRILA